MQQLPFNHPMHPLGPNQGAHPDYTFQKYHPVDTSTTNTDLVDKTTGRTVHDEAYDLVSGQDAAAKISQALLDLKAQEMDQLMNDPLAAVATGDRIRSLIKYLEAYHAGQPVTDEGMVVIPKTRKSVDKTTTTTNSESGSGTNTSTGTDFLNITPRFTPSM